MEPRYLDIKKATTDREPEKQSWSQRLRNKLKNQPAGWRLRWQLLDFNLTGMLIYGAIIVLAFGSAVLFSRIIAANANKQPVLEKAPRFSDFEVEPLDQSGASPPAASPTKSESETSSPANDPFLPSEAEKQIQAASEINKDSFQTKILNGNGITGQAAKAKKTLESQGFKISSIGNAKNRYSQTQIYYKPGKQAEAQLIKQALGQEAPVNEAQDSLIGEGAEILIVLGAK